MAFFNRLFLLRQQAALRKDALVPIKGPVRAVHARKNRLQAVIILLPDGIEFMVVTAGAMDREAVKSGDGAHYHVIAIVVTRDEAVGLFDWQLKVADEIPRARGDES